MTYKLRLDHVSITFRATVSHLRENQFFNLYVWIRLVQPFRAFWEAYTFQLRLNHVWPRLSQQSYNSCFWIIRLDTFGATVAQKRKAHNNLQKWPPRYLAPGTWHRAPDTCYRVPGTRYQVPGTWYHTWYQVPRYLVPWGQVPGSCYLVPGTWYQVPGTWSQVPGTWYQVAIWSSEGLSITFGYVWDHVWLRLRAPLQFPQICPSEGSLIPRPTHPPNRVAREVPPRPPAPRLHDLSLRFVIRFITFH